MVKEQDQPENSNKFTLWREDDYGNRFIIRLFDTEDEALTEFNKFQLRGHKQLYNITHNLAT